MFKELMQNKADKKPVDLTPINTISTSIANELLKKKLEAAGGSTTGTSGTPAGTTPSDTQKEMDQDTDTK